MKLAMLWRPLLLAAILALIPAQALAYPPPPQGRPATVAVPATQPWTDTGVDLTGGNPYRVQASGIINVYGGRADSYKTPAGGPNCTAPYGGHWIGAGLSCWSLIGQIGPSGAPFEIGNGTVFTADRSGRLYLGVNDESTYSFVDNSGGWWAQIESMFACIFDPKTGGCLP